MNAPVCCMYSNNMSSAFRRSVPCARQLHRQFSSSSHGGPTTTTIKDSASPGILQEYSRMVSEGRLQPDPSQLAATQALQLLQYSLLDHVRSKQQQHHEQHQQNAMPPSQAGPAVGGSEHSLLVQGAYLWGPVGSGKTLLGDLFLKTLPTAVQASSNLSHSSPPAVDSGSSSSNSASSSSASSSGAGNWQQHHGAFPSYAAIHVEAERLHYHTFMLGVHQQLHQLQQSLPKVVTRSRNGLPVFRHALPPEDPVLTVARAAAAHTDLLFLDELHVTDVADAMLLSRLFGELMRCGTWVVFTSNRPARDLYKGGLSRRYFEPFIRLVDSRLLQLRVAGGQDYRLTRSSQDPQQHTNQQQHQHHRYSAPKQAPAAAGIWLVGPDGNTQLQQQWQQLVQQAQPNATEAAVASKDGGGSGAGGPAAHSAVGGPAVLQLPFGRSLWVPRAVQQPLHQQQQQDEPHQQHEGWQQQQQQQQDALQQQQQQQQQGQQQLQAGQQLAGAYFTFEQLCGNSGSSPTLATGGALSATDYLALVQRCRRLFIEGVPQLQPSQRDEARRLVTLVDLLYEAHTVMEPQGAEPVQLAVSAAVEPHELFLPLLGAAALQGVNPNLGRSSNKLDVKTLLQEAKAAAGANSSANAPGSGVAGEDATVGGRPPASWSAGGAAGAAAAQGASTTGQAAAAAAETSQPGTGELPTQVGQESHPPNAAQQPQPPALLAEEVLMYHRASSRLAELCAVSHSL